MGVGKKCKRRFPLFTIGLQAIAVVLSGCVGRGDPREAVETPILPFLPLLSLGPEVRVIEDQGNDSFDTATSFPLVEGEPLAVQGGIDRSSDVDVYDLGEMFSGDRLVVDIESHDGLDAVVAVFDADANLIYLNDDRNFFAGLVDPHIDFVLRRDMGRCHVVVASSPNSRSFGTYTLAAAVMPDRDLPPPQPQTVLLNFDGAQAVEFGGRPPVAIPPFDAAAISETLDGLTDLLIDLILEHVRGDYTGLNVEIYTSLDAVDLGPEVSTIHFGAFDRALLGVAENIDEFNERTVQEGIIFTDTFKVFNVLDPTVKQFAQALANVASHEIGHLLGLVHTADTRGVMDITASLRQLMRDQAFSQSPLESSTFPLGFQDASLALVESVGGDLEAVRANSLAQLEPDAARVINTNEREDGLPDPPRPVFSTCMRNTCEIAKLKRRAADVACVESSTCDNRIDRRAAH